jgi:hypothetical protein
MAERTTDVHIMHKVNELTRLMREAGILKPDSHLTLHQGSNGPAKYNNYLLVGKTNVWPNGEGGRTKKECYNALRHMIAALSLAIEAQQDGKPIA